MLTRAAPPGPDGPLHGRVFPPAAPETAGPCRTAHRLGSAGSPWGRLRTTFSRAPQGAPRRPLRGEGRRSAPPRPSLFPKIKEYATPTYQLNIISSHIQRLAAKHVAAPHAGLCIHRCTRTSPSWGRSSSRRDCSCFWGGWDCAFFLSSCSCSLSGAAIGRSKYLAVPSGPRQRVRILRSMSQIFGQGRLPCTARTRCLRASVAGGRETRAYLGI